MRRIGGEYEASLSREMLETILKETVTGIAIVSPRVDGIQLDYTNDGFFSLFGYTRDEYEELPEDVRMNLLNPEDFMNTITRINTDYAPGEIQKFECRINKKGGETGWVLISTRKPRDAKKGEQTFVCNLVDITDTKKLQMQLQKEKERYEIVEEVSDNIIFNYDVVTDTFEASSKLLRGLGTNTKIT
ncbi:MAG: PAS domain-containing protein, partial [Clostridia bacterium]|nr:PAS domain-containing protein [Clostridia bacterium]